MLCFYIVSHSLIDALSEHPVAIPLSIAAFLIFRYVTKKSKKYMFNV